MKRLYRRFIALLAVLLLGSCLFTASVAAKTFTHIEETDGSVTSILAREAYTPVKAVSASGLGLEEAFGGLNDIFVTKDQRVFLLCADDSRLVVLRPDYSLDRIITITTPEGEEEYFTGAQGLYVDDNGDLYIADTNNGRILIADGTGRLQSVWEAPDSHLLPDDFLYQPTRLVKDADGYTYVLSMGCYYGALTFSPENEFTGFYGANTVQATALDTLSYLWDLLTGSDAKKEGSAKKLPYSFVDLCMDAQGYMITCTGKMSTGTNGVGQLRRIGPDGSNLLYKRGRDGRFSSSSSINLLEKKVVVRFRRARVQDIVSLDVDPQGYMFALDRTYGFIYLYDRECNLINGFGGGTGSGGQLGTFQTPSAIAVHGDRLLVADTSLSSLTVFERTSYGKALMEAQSLYIDGEYTQAGPLWQEVLSLDRGSQLACRGLAMCSYMEGRYEEAMAYAETGLDYTVYDLAWKEVLNRFIAGNFVWLFPIVLVGIGGLTVLLIRIRKRKTAWITNPKLSALTAVTFHPFRAFDEIKYKNRGSVLLGVVLAALFFLAKTLEYTASGFLFTSSSAKSYNVLFTLAQTAVLVLLWSVINWLVCTLFSGKGRLREIFLGTSYSLVPLIVFTFLRVLLSHLLPYAGQGLLNGLYMVVLLYTFYLLSVALMTVHEYTFPKFILTSIVTVLGMLLFIFIVMMIGILLQQFGDFLYSIYTEVIYR